jgi:hypothetical protein
MFSTNFKADGPLGGFLAGMGDSFSLANADRDLVDRDRKSSLDQLALENEQLNTPVRAAKRAEELARSEFEQQQFASGRKQELADAERDIKIQQAIAGKDENQKRQLAMQAEGMVKARAMISDEDLQAGDQLLMQAKWDEAVKVMEAHGVKNPPKQFTVPAYERLKQGATAAMATIPYLQETAKLTQQQTFLGAEHRLNRESTEKIASEHDTAAIRAAGIRASATVSTDSKMELKPTKQRMEAKFVDQLEAQESDPNAPPIKADHIERYLGFGVDSNVLIKAKEHVYNQVTDQALLNKDSQTRLAKKYGLPPNAPAADIGRAAAEKEGKELVYREERKKFQGAKIEKDGKMVTVNSDGEYVGPDGLPVDKPVFDPTPANRQRKEGPVKAISGKQTPARPAGFIEREKVDNGKTYIEYAPGQWKLKGK